MTMKWHKFLVNFGLWLNAALMLMLAVTAFSGAQYGNEAEQVYRVFDGLEPIDKLYGMLHVAQAVFIIITRFRLAALRTSGVKFLLATYWISLIVEVGYMLVVGNMIGAGLEILSESSSQIAGTVVGYIVNRTYYKKREHLFTEI